MIVPVISPAKRLAIYVQNSSRSQVDRVGYPACVKFIDCLLSLVLSQTTALAPLVLRNECRVWVERNDTQFDSENNSGIIGNIKKQFAQFRLAGGQPQNWRTGLFQLFSRDGRSKFSGAES
jgi:hypothetical protein